jgi:aryl-phospho-beta-D-glucosidase BglC (GH1 family)
LAREGARGYIGEINWPNNKQRPFDDEAQWNTLGEKWYRWADENKLWVTMWCVDEWQRWGGFWLTTYVSLGDGRTRPISQPLAQTPVNEAHLTTAYYSRGINVSGAERWEEGINSKRGTYYVDYWYASQETMEYLASRGTRIIRLPFRWERIQPALGGALNTFELTQLQNCVARAAKAGLRVILDLHNYAGYQLSVNKKTSREYKLGSSKLPASYLYDVWRRLSESFKSNSAVVAYGIMNEPVNMPAAGYASPEKAWESYSQGVVSNIRNNGDNKLIMVPGYHWSMAREWDYHHPERWISDPVNNHVYEAHHYFDEGSGYYNRSYDDAVAYWRSQGY